GPVTKLARELIALRKSWRAILPPSATGTAGIGWSLSAKACLHRSTSATTAFTWTWSSGFSWVRLPARFEPGSSSNSPTFWHKPRPCSRGDDVLSGGSSANPADSRVICFTLDLCADINGLLDFRSTSAGFFGSPLDGEKHECPTNRDRLDPAYPDPCCWPSRAGAGASQRADRQCADRPTNLPSSRRHQRVHHAQRRPDFGPARRVVWFDRNRRVATAQSGCRQDGPHRNHRSGFPLPHEFPADVYAAGSDRHRVHRPPGLAIRRGVAHRYYQRRSHSLRSGRCQWCALWPWRHAQRHQRRCQLSDQLPGRRRSDPFAEVAHSESESRGSWHC